MKILISIYFIFLINLQLLAQTLGGEATGKSIILYPGATAGIDFQRANFGVSYTTVSNDTAKRYPIYGFTINARNRSGMTSLLNKGISAPSLEFLVNYGRVIKNSIIYGSIGFNSFRFNRDSLLMPHEVKWSSVVAVFGINHQIENKWFIGYGIGAQLGDNFTDLKPWTVDTVNANTQQNTFFSKQDIVYKGIYKTFAYYPFKFQLTYVGQVAKGGNLIFTPFYGSFGKLTNLELLLHYF